MKAFVPTDRHLKVVDLGSATSEERVESGLVHRTLFADHDAEIVGLDVIEGPNVDMILEKPYRLPLKTNSVDVVISGQAFEHIPFFWATTLEIARVLKPGGVFLMTAPSRGHKHMLVDCWRYYDDGVRAIAAFTGMVVRRAHTDFPVKKPGPARIWPVEHDVDVDGYWGDTVGVLQKPDGYPTHRMWLVRGPVVWWANRTAKAFAISVDEAEERRVRRVEREKKQAHRRRKRQPDKV